MDTETAETPTRNQEWSMFSGILRKSTSKIASEAVAVDLSTSDAAGSVQSQSGENNKCHKRDTQRIHRGNRANVFCSENIYS